MELVQGHQPRMHPCASPACCNENCGWVEVQNPPSQHEPGRLVIHASKKGSASTPRRVSSWFSGSAQRSFLMARTQNSLMAATKKGRGCSCRQPPAIENAKGTHASGRQQGVLGVQEEPSRTDLTKVELLLARLATKTTRNYAECGTCRTRVCRCRWISLRVAPAQATSQPPLPTILACPFLAPSSLVAAT